MFTNLPLEKVKEHLSLATQTAYLQGGQIATQTVVIPAGPLDKAMFAGPMEPEFRRLGMHTKLENEVIVV